jgi:hypothetical protein
MNAVRRRRGWYGHEALADRLVALGSKQRGAVALIDGAGASSSPPSSSRMDGGCRTNPGVPGSLWSRHRTRTAKMSLVEKPRNKRDFSTTLREIKANRRAATEPVVRSSQIPRFVRHPRLIRAASGDAAQDFCIPWRCKQPEAGRPHCRSGRSPALSQPSARRPPESCGLVRRENGPLSSPCAIT